MPKFRPPLDPKVSMWHFLAYYLRFLREKEGLSLTQWGGIIGAARSTVSNQEAGRQKIHEDQAKIIDARFGTGRMIELLLFFARMAHSPNWFQQFSQYEQGASSIKVYHGEIVPLPAQTDEYTWACVRESTVKDRETEQESRVQRKRGILEREDPPFLWMVIGEAALAQQMGGREIMRRQLQHLLEISELPHVSVRIVPFSVGAHPGVDGYFHVIAVEGRDIAYAGAQNGGRLIEDPSEVRELIS